MVKKLLHLIIILFITIPLSGIHPDLDTFDFWVKVNKGFGKCPSIKESSGEAAWNIDDFEIKTLLHRRGLAYAWIGYGIDYENKQPCAEGLYYHDTITNKWIKVAEKPTDLYSIDELFTNGNEIFAFAHTQKYTQGLILQYTSDYVNYPHGWKEISKGFYRTLEDQEVFPDAEIIGLGGDPDDEGIWGFDNSFPREAIGDTIYVWFWSRAVPGHNKMGKFSTKDGNWRFETLPSPPRGTSFIRKTITDYIGGYFRYFVGYRDAYKKLSIGGIEGFECGMSTDFADEALPQAIFVYDPRDGTWKDISRGPNWCNLTPSAATGAGSIYNSWDKKRMIMVNQQGTWEWQGDRWNYHNDRIKAIEIISSNGIYYRGATHSGSLGGGGGYNERFINANFMILGPLQDPNCVCNEDNYCVNYEQWISPDDGRSIYAIQQSRDPINCEGLGAADNEWKDIGIYRLTINERKEQSIRNLHVEAATYLGGSGGENKPVNVGVGDGYKLFVAGNFSSITPQRAGHPAWIVKNYNGANNLSKGRIIVLNRWADTILQVINLGNTVYKYEMQNWGENRMAISGDWGVSSLDSSGNLIWTVPISSLGTTGELRCDIDDIGNVAVLNKGNKRWYVIAADGTIKTSGGNSVNAPTSIGLKGDVYHTKSDYPQDIAILNDTVFVVGFNNDKLNNPATPICGENSSLAVQSNFLRAWANDGSNNYSFIWRTYDIKGGYLGLDQADSRLYRINIGKNNKLYALGEQANANGVFRWNGKTSVELEALEHDSVCDQGTNHGTYTTITTDRYDALWGFCQAVHIGYYCIINPGDGVVQRGQFLSTIKSDGCKNSFRTQNGYIHADAKGYVYVMGISAASYPNREVQYINGQLIGEYSGGDPTITIVRPDLTVRTFYGSFPDTAATGTLCGVGIKDNWIAMVGFSPKGKMITGATRVTDPVYRTTEFKKEWAINPEPFNLNWTTGGLNDAYIAVWYQDVWNHSQEILEPNPIPGDTIICDSAFFCKADFKVKELPIPDYPWGHQEEYIHVCKDKEITFTDLSVCGVDWTWDFGEGASLLPGTKGKGPHPVYYKTTGLKTVNLWTNILSKTVDCEDTVIIDREEKPDYINVLPNDLSLSNISGPTLACEGTEAYFEVEPIFGVTEYTWTIPAGTEILDGSTSNKIHVQLGESSGIISVYGKYVCGITATKSLSITVNPASDNKLLFLVGSSTLSTGDMTLKTKLQQKGYDVWTVDDDNLEESFTGCVTSVLVSNSVNEEKVGYRLREAPVPVIVLKPELYQKMGFTYGNNAIDYGTSTSVNKLQILDDKHELAAGLPLGDAQVYTGTSSINWGYPSNEALMIAKVNNNDARLSLFAYETGSTMKDGYVAPSRRVALYLNSTASGSMTANGDSLLAYSLCWANSNCRLSNTIDISNVSTSSLCPGETFTLDYIATGDFGRRDMNPAVPPIIIDNASSHCYVYGDYHNWKTESVTSGYYSTNYINNYKYASRRVEERAVFVPEIQYNGTYKISINYPSASTNAAIVPIDIIDGYGNTTKKNIDQRTGGNWKELGTFYLKAGNDNKVVVWAYGASNANVLWDAVKFEPVSIEPNLIYNSFKAELSNKYGSFAGEITEIGFIKDSISGIILATIPKDLLPGNEYKVRISSTSPALKSTPWAVPITIKDYPDNAGPISGQDEPCIGQSIQTYSVAPVASAEYIWEVPLGASITNPSPTGNDKTTIRTSSNQVTVDFGTSTANSIKVWLIDGCGKSIDASELYISMNHTIPEPVGTINGDTLICSGGEYKYSIALVNNATSYEWMYPSWMSVVGIDTQNIITLKINPGIPNGTIGEIKVRAINHCGANNWKSLPLKIDNIKTLPQLGELTGDTSFCKGESGYFKLVPAVNYATYKWLMPTGAVLEENNPVNTAKIKFPINTTGEIKLTVTNACGASSISKNVQVGTGGSNKAVLVVNNPLSITGNDLWIKNRLETTHGYTVELVDDDSPEPSDINCANLVIISTTASNVGTKYSLVEIPVIINNTNAMVNHGIAGNSGTQQDNQLRITDNSHPIVSGLTNNQTYKVYNKPDTDEGYIGGAGTYNIQPCSEDNYTSAWCFAKSDERDYTLLSYEPGEAMGKNGLLGVAPSKRLAFFLADNNSPLSSIGEQLFDKSICWATNTCGNPVIDVFVSGTEQCKGDSIQVVFSVTKNFNTGNVFTIQLSDSSGSFSTPITLGNISSVTSESVKYPLSTTIPNGNHYRVRVVSSSPIVESSPNATPLIISNCVICNVIITGTSSNPTCNGSIDGEISIIASNIYGKANYLWSNGASDSLISGLNAGTYTVTVTDSLSCKAQKEYTLTDPIEISANTTVSNISCHGFNDGSLSVNISGGTPPYQFYWNTGDTTSTIDSLFAGNYYLNYHDINNCSDSFWLELTEPLPLNITATITPVSIHGNNDGNIDITIAGGTSPYSYSWSNGFNIEDLDSLTANDYYLSISDSNQCILFDTFSVKEPEVLAIVDSIKNAGCYGSNDGAIIITSITGGISPYHFKWNTNSTQQLLTSINAGQYTVTVTDSSGAFLVKNFEVSQPPKIIASAGNDLAICKGQTAVLEVTGGNQYLWDNGSTLSSLSVSPTTTRIYQVKISDTSGCYIYDTLKVTVNPLPMVELGNTKHICEASDTVLAAPYGMSNYTWKKDTTLLKNGIEPYLFVSNAGKYYVTVSDNNNCINEDSVEVKTYPLPLAKISEPDIYYVCPGTPFSIHAHGGDSYLWNNQKKDSIITEILYAPTNYSVTVTENYGVVQCSDRTDIIVNTLDWSFPILNRSTDSVYIGYHDTLLVVEEPGHYYSWTIHGGIISGDSIHTPLVYVLWDSDTTSNAWVKIKDSSATGCINSYVYHYVIYSPPPIGIVLNKITNISCYQEKDGEIDIAVNGGLPPYKIIWNNGKTNTTLTGLEPGKYSVSVEDELNNTSSAEFIITEPEALTAVISIDKEILCPGETAIINTVIDGGTTPYRIYWNDTESDIRFETGIPGTYSLVISDKNNCNYQQTIELLAPDTTLIALKIVHPYCLEKKDGSIEIEVIKGMIKEVLWSINSTSLKIEELEAGTYSYTVTDTNSCSQSDSIELIPLNNLCIEAASAFSPNNDQVNDFWKIENLIHYYPNATVSIFDRWGILVFQSNRQNPVWNGTFNGAPLPVDCYHYIIDFGNGTLKQGQIVILR